MDRFPDMIGRPPEYSGEYNGGLREYPMPPPRELISGLHFMYACTYVV